MTKEFGNKGEKTNIHTPKKSFTDSISQLMTVHASLCDTVMLINAAYGVITLVITITCLIHLIITPYFSIMEADGKGDGKPLFLVVQGLWCIFHIWRLFMIVQPTYAATIEVDLKFKYINQLTVIYTAQTHKRHCKNNQRLS
ncbi:gustatory receptor for sugar taste 43a-like [Monomorium pharaonis]|uniref:gustatory receptor for sugar taste 43a-like n=1 Tax=Monomorium pharaonis TaxID=307658 RepID=UPI00174723D0|nr:gustatory receptor for sugar taste 43a-like [Monomorium pharaonis]